MIMIENGRVFRPSKDSPKPPAGEAFISMSKLTWEPVAESGLSESELR